MAAYSGKEGKVTVQASGGSETNVAAVRSWTVNNTAEVLDATVMNPNGVTYRTNVASFLAWDGSASLLWDDAGDTGQALCVPGNTLSVVFYPEGFSVGDTAISGDAIITAMNLTASFDGLIEMEVTFTGTGPLTTGTMSV